MKFISESKERLCKKKNPTETSQTKNDLPEEVVFQALGMSDYLTDHRILNAWTDLKQSGDRVLSYCITDWMSVPLKFIY